MPRETDDMPTCERFGKPEIYYTAIVTEQRASASQMPSTQASFCKKNVSINAVVKFDFFISKNTKRESVVRRDKRQRPRRTQGACICLKLPDYCDGQVSNRLPHNRTPKQWNSMNEPVVSLERNLYSHPWSGLLGKEKLEEVLIKQF